MREPNCAVWLIYENKKLVGYFVTMMISTWYESHICLIEQLCVKGIRMVREMEKVVVKWAKENNAKKMMFNTYRNPNAFIRLLKTPFKIESTVLVSFV